MNLVINKKTHTVIPISKLTFNSFNQILVEREVFDLKGYISLFVELPVDELMSSEIETISMPALHASIFDIDIKKQVKSTPKTFKYGEHTYIVDEMTLSTFGQNYIFDLYYEKYKEGKLNIYEISIYAVACHITKTFDMSEVDRIYNDICSMKWVDCLPAAFFLARRFLRKKKGSRLLSIAYTVELTRMRLLSRYRMIKHQSLVRKLFPKRFVRSLNAV